MKIFITGGGGVIGGRLAAALLARGALAGIDGNPQKIDSITLFDTVFPHGGDPRLRRVSGDLSVPGALAAAIDRETQIVFHFAAVVSSGAEADFDLGMRVNLDGTRQLLEACRTLARPPRLVFSSSVAAFGGELPEVLSDATTPTPQTSYGVQKVIGEYLVGEYSRRGFIDGRSLRLPTIIVRPGRPNLAASSFASGVIREPLNGEISPCPVPAGTGVWALSLRRVIDAFIHACELPASAWGWNRVLNLPGIAVTVSDMVAALAKIAGPEAAARVQFRPDERIERIVRTWPVRFRTDRALALGFEADADLESIIRAYVEDEGIKLPA